MYIRNYNINHYNNTSLNNNIDFIRLYKTNLYFKNMFNLVWL